MISILLAAALAASPDLDLPDVHVGRPRVRPTEVYLAPLAGGPAARDAQDALSVALRASGLFDVVSPDAPALRWRITGSVASGAPASATIRILDAAGRETRALTIRGAPRAIGHALADALIAELRAGPGPFSARLAAVRAEGRSHRIVVADWDGRNERTAYVEDGPLALHGWRPDGGALLFTTWRRGRPEVWLLELATGSARPLLAVGELTTAATFSPRGDRIAFVAVERGNADVYVAAADGSGIRRLTTDAGVDTSPTWSPDGARIAFLSEREGRPHVFVMNADGTNSRRAAWSLAEEQAPRFAPRGDALAFAGRDADGWGLYTVSVGGAGSAATPAPLRVAGASRVPEASWDPSALLLAFADPAAGVVVATADGARITVLPATGGLASVAWGPGRR